MASLVELEPAPAITGTRPAASSMHHSTTRLCSSWLTVGLSPVVPTGTRPWVPSAICQLTSPRNAASSSEPFLNGVTKAVNDPRKFVLAAMNFSKRWLRALPHPFHTGSDGYTEGLNLPRRCLVLLPATSWQPSKHIAAAILPRRWRRHPLPAYLLFCPHIQSNRPRTAAIS